MSQKTLFNKTALAVAVAIVSTSAWSAGFQLNEFSSSGLGRAYSGEGAIADDAGNASRNPALIMMFDRPTFSAGAVGTVAKLAMRQPFVLFKGLTFQKLCLPGAFRPGDHHNKMLRPGLCVMHASPQYL